MTDELEVVADDDDDEEEGGGPLGGIDLSSLLAQAQSMQQQLLEAQSRAAEQVVEGQAGGGVVRIRVSGGLEFQDVTIDPSVVDRDDVDMLQDLVLAALRDALAKINALNEEAMGGLGGALGGLLS
jgi:DNA-binding YbaB/EbfC family protein